MNNYPAQFLGCLLLAACASNATAATAAKTDGIVIGQRFQMESKLLGETRTYLVRTPSDYERSTDAYPVLVLLDGESNFAHTTAAVETLSSGRIPPMIVVGINNTDRSRDLTPTAPKTGWGGTPWTGSAGGADQFLAFIADELLPSIDRNYRTRPYRVLIGHSFGGLFAIHALLTRPEVFDGYLAISPSLWWDDQAMLKAVPPFLESHQDLSADLYMTMGDEGEAMLGGAWKLSAYIEENRPAQLRWQFKRSPEEDHGSIPYISTYQGLQEIFAGYRIPAPFALFEEQGLAGFDKHYAKVSQRLGYQVPVPAEALWNVTEELQKRKRLDEAQAVVDRALELKPNDAWGLIQAAQLAEARKDEPQAIKLLTRALQAYPGSATAREMLTKRAVDVEAIAPSLELTAKLVAPYLGSYRLGEDLKTVSYSDNKLFAEGADGKCELHALTPTKFYCVDEDIEFSFSKGSNGRVRGATIDLWGTAGDYQKVK